MGGSNSLGGVPKMMFSSLGSRVRTGGDSKRSMAWSSQMMLSSQRPYNSSSLSMGKMENQGASSSWEAAEEHRGGRIAQADRTSGV